MPPSGTVLLRANLPLWDAEQAAFSLRGADYAINWRFDYIVALATLRAVGHVLHKVDCVAHPEIVAEVSSRYKRWQRGEGDDAIFPYFIEKVRNQLLKAYVFSVGDEVSFEDEELGLVGKDEAIFTIAEGPLSGWNVVAAIELACSWWAKELAEVDKIIQKNTNTPFDQGI